jgi:hypothetical protein
MGGKGEIGGSPPRRPLVGEIVVVEGVSLKGKNRVRELGRKWRVVETHTPSEHLRGRIAIAPAIHPKMPYIRFIDPVQDEHFRILEIE